MLHLNETLHYHLYNNKNLSDRSPFVWRQPCYGQRQSNTTTNINSTNHLADQSSEFKQSTVLNVIDNVTGDASKLLSSSWECYENKYLVIKDLTRCSKPLVNMQFGLIERHKTPLVMLLEYLWLSRVSKDTGSWSGDYVKIWQYPATVYGFCLTEFTPRRFPLFLPRSFTTLSACQPHVFCFGLFVLTVSARRGNVFTNALISWLICRTSGHKRSC